AVVALVATLGPAGPAGSVSGPRSTYIVELAAPPLAAYDGTVGALAATSPRVTGQRLDPGAAPVRRYRALLERSQRRVLSAARAGPDRAAEGVKTGVIDTGIYPEHPSFADTPDGPDGPDGQRYDGPAYPAPSDWKGTCQAGADFPATTCNHKLIGARYFVEG